MSGYGTREYPKNTINKMSYIGKIPAKLDELNICEFKADNCMQRLIVFKLGCRGLEGEVGGFSHH